MNLLDTTTTGVSTAANETFKIGKLMAGLAEKAIEATWSLVDAAAHKELPGEYLSQQAINAIQGKAPGK